jgi:hypothetical protein
LYRDGTLRPYRDIDILVAPADWSRASIALAEIGFRRWLAGAHWSEHIENEQELVDAEGVTIDLHRWIVGGPRDRARQAWDLLHGGADLMELGGRQVHVLRESARVLHLALHAAQNGPAGRKSLQDLERGLELVPRRRWEEAAQLAATIGASPAFAAGLRLCDAGRPLADALQLDERLGVEQALRAMSAPEYAQSLARKVELGSLRATAVAAAREMWPSPAAASGWHADATRGGLRRVAWRLRRPFWVLARLPLALLWLWRAKRTSRLPMRPKS